MEKLVCGDEVLVRATVKYDSTEDGSDVAIEIGSYGTTVFIDRKTVKLIAPRIRVGDEVQQRIPGHAAHIGHKSPGVVIAVADERAWVCFPERHMVCGFDELCRFRTRDEIAEALAKTLPEAA